MRHNSRTWELPLELCDIPGERCECGAVVWTAKGGNITATYVAGKTKGCVVCGRQLRARYWQGYGPILAAAGPLRLLKATDAEWRKRQREVRDGGWQALPIPVEGGRHVYTTAPHLGDPVEDLAGELLASLLAMTNDSRRMRATGSEDRPGWRQAWQAFLKATAVPPSSGEYVGTSPAPSLPRARMAAEHFGLLVRDLAKGDGLVIRDVRESDPATWHRFAAMVGIRKWVPNEGREAA